MAPSANIQPDFEISANKVDGEIPEDMNLDVLLHVRDNQDPFIRLYDLAKLPVLQKRKIQRQCEDDPNSDEFCVELQGRAAFKTFLYLGTVSVSPYDRMKEINEEINQVGDDLSDALTEVDLLQGEVEDLNVEVDFYQDFAAFVQDQDVTLLEDYEEALSAAEAPEEPDEAPDVLEGENPDEEDEGESEPKGNPQQKPEPVVDTEGHTVQRPDTDQPGDAGSPEESGGEDE